MNFPLSLSRRDVVALVMYATLAHNILSSLFYLLCQVVLPRIPWFQSSVAGPPMEYAVVNFVTSFVFALAFLPLVSFIARVVTGRRESEIVMPRHVLFLVLPCLGVMLFVMSMSSLMRGIVDLARLMATSGSMSSTVFPYTIEGLASSFGGIIVGFAVAICPSLFGVLRARTRDEETAA